MKQFLLNCVSTGTLMLFVATNTVAQLQPFFNASPGEGNGFRFWAGDDHYKIHMGTGSEYWYGPVTDYSIKNNMVSMSNRGWTWGSLGATPIAALNTLGHMQIAGDFLAMGNLGIGTTTPGAKLEVNGDVRVGSNSASETGPGSRLHLLGASENSDLLWLGRHNWGSNNSELRVNIGDDAGGDDALTIGNFYYLDGQWRTFMKVLNNGKMGIGTGAGAVTSDASFTVNLQNTSGWSGNLKAIKIAGPDSNYSLDLSTYVVTGGNAGYHFSPNGNTGLVITTPGNVGIGTTAPDAKLSVKGQVHAQEVKVDLNGSVAPDYVFNKDYKLPSLEEVKLYIEKNNHLPEVPSAKEMEVNGMNLGEMNLLLLKKVEELTLYAIEQDKRNQDQDALIKMLISELSKVNSK